MGEGEKGEECFHGKSDTGWMVVLVRLFFRGGFRGRLRRKEGGNCSIWKFDENV